MPTVSINHPSGNKIIDITISSELWDRIDYVDYIMFDKDHCVHPDFSDHSEIVLNNMQYIIDCTRLGQCLFENAEKFVRPESSAKTVSKMESDLGA